MNESVTNCRRFMADNGLDCFLVNSTNEFLVEYNSLEENSRYHLTGFSGSTGDAVVTCDTILLFVDGRYHIQADLEVNPHLITVVKLKTGEKMSDKMKEFFSEGTALGVVAKKNSLYRIEAFKEYFDVKLFDNDPFEKSLSPSKDEIFDVDLKYTGMDYEEKLSRITSDLNTDDAVLLTCAEDVSYLFNKRDFSKPYSSKITAKAIVSKNGAEFFTRNRSDEFENNLKSIKGKVFVDKKTVNAHDFSLIKNISIVEKNPVQQMRSVKTDSEIEHYKEAFSRTDKALKAIRDYIENNNDISEFDIAAQLEKEFIRFGAQKLSFKSIVAKDKNSALAHYAKCSKDEIIKNGSLVLVDCGAYYEGGLATDITRVFVKGEPSFLQKKVYTTVLKTFLNSFNFLVNPKTSGFDIDALARQIVDENKVEGFVFNHGLGHGIGLSVHEYPPNLSNNELAKVTLKENMCFTIEPGLYNQEHFGIRLENSCFLKNGKINSFVNMNYEKKLIDYNLLTEQEKVWLKDFEVL